MDIAALVEQMNRDGSFREIVNNPLSQLGASRREYLGATLLPNRNVPQNKYTEQGIKYRSIIANDGTRYSPVQIKGGVLAGSFDVELGESDIGSQFTGPEYDVLVEMLRKSGGNAAPESAVRNMLQWADVTLNIPLEERLEKQRWDAIVDASVVREGDNGYTETVAYSNPSGHRVAAAAAWSNDANDPMDDIVAGMNFLHGKGYEVNRIFAGRTVINFLLTNAKMQARAGLLSIVGGVITGLRARLDKAALDSLLGRDGLPGIEEYNLQYRTDTGSDYFLDRASLVMVATTGRDDAIDFGDNETIPLPDTLGYTAIGRPQGMDDPGRAIRTEVFDKKPFRVEGEAWQTAAPVITEPEAIYVIHTIS